MMSDLLSCAVGFDLTLYLLGIFCTRVTRSELHIFLGKMCGLYEQSSKGSGIKKKIMSLEEYKCHRFKVAMQLVLSILSPIDDGKRVCL